MNKLYQSLYDEFGEEQVHTARRKIMAQTGQPPSYIEIVEIAKVARG